MQRFRTISKQKNKNSIPVPSNGVMSSQSDNVVTFDWPPVHQGIEPETNFKILSLRRGLYNFLNSLMMKTLATGTKICHIDQ